jgi:hypothetical protein
VTLQPLETKSRLLISRLGCMLHTTKLPVKVLNCWPTRVLPKIPACGWFTSLRALMGPAPNPNTGGSSCLPILNALALTIHKVQGLSLPSITLGLNKNIFSEGQAYVGLSRATTLDQVFLTQLDFDAINLRRILRQLQNTID